MLDLFRWLARPGLLIAAAALACGVAAQTPYPERQVRVIVPYTAGGNTDLIARTIMAELSRRTGQSFVVENRAGANGMIGTDIVAKAAPDGYTLAFVIPAFAYNQALYEKMPYTPSELTGVTMMTRVPVVLLVHPALAIRNVEELIAYTRANPGKLAFATSGAGSMQNLLTQELMVAAKSGEVLHTPYKASVDAFNDLLSGRVGLMFDSIPVTSSFMESGKLRPIAVSSIKRSPLLPQVPTLIESGYPGLSRYAWSGLLTPSATPKPIIDKLHRDITAVLQTPAVREKLEGMSAEIVGSSPAEFNAFLVQEVAKSKEVFGKLGIKLE